MFSELSSVRWRFNKRRIRRGPPTSRPVFVVADQRSMGMERALSPTAHPRRRVLSTAMITVVLLILCSVGRSDAQSLVQRPTSPFRLAQQQQQYQNVHRRSLTSSKTDNTSALQRFFEVSTPVISNLSDCHVEMIQLMYHEFAFTYNIPPPNASYVPTKKVVDNKWDKVVLKWSAVCRGLQFDRIAAVWLGGVEILRTCTAEPTSQGIIWEVEKDVTQYASLWKNPQQVVISLNNIVDSTYTGIINVTLSVNFYKVGHGDGHGDDFQPSKEADLHSSKRSKLESYSAKPADVIIPIGNANYINSSGGYGGYWFYLANETENFNKSLQIPPNTYKAVLEVCVSSHGTDEFWYVNTNVNGAFREVVVFIDEDVVGVVYPFPVIYTGGYNPLYWQPAAAIGAFDLPSYDLDITPLVGRLLDDQNHTFRLTVTDAMDYWLLQGNLHIWVDPKIELTKGMLVEFKVPLSSNPNSSTSQNGTVVTTASRKFSYVGFVVSSFGNLTTNSSHTLMFSNTQFDGAVYQKTETVSIVVLQAKKKAVAYHQVESSYPFSYDVNGLQHALQRQTHSMNMGSRTFSSLINNQTAVYIDVDVSTQQTLSYESNIEGCYQRAINVLNNALVNDSSTTQCPSTY